MDIIKYYGGTPANFLDVGGSATDIKEDNIKVIDDENNIINTEIKIKEDKVQIEPVEEYIIGKIYSIIIGKDIESKKSIKLQQNITMPFRIVYGAEEWEVVKEYEVNSKNTNWYIVPTKGSDLDTFNEDTVYITDENDIEIPVILKNGYSYCLKSCEVLLKHIY